jgi:hypothetical protein
LKVKCVFGVSLQLFLKNSHYKKKWAKYDKNCISVSCKVPCIIVKYPVLLSHVNETWIFLDSYSKSTQIPNFMKICRVGAEFFYVDRQTHRQDEANSRFPPFCKHASPCYLCINKHPHVNLFPRINIGTLFHANRCFRRSRDPVLSSQL